jgi:hypothetical protein
MNNSEFAFLPIPFKSNIKNQISKIRTMPCCPHPKNPNGQQLPIAADNRRHPSAKTAPIGTYRDLSLAIGTKITFSVHSFSTERHGTSPQRFCPVSLNLRADAECTKIAPFLHRF